MRVLVCWSGGKNSTRAIFEHLKLGNTVTAVCYIPYFDKDIPLICKEHFNFLYYMRDVLRSLGVEVVFLKGVTYFDWCVRILVKGKNKGLRQCFPFFMRGACGFARDGKIKSINSFLDSNIDKFDFVDIGICADEFDRKTMKGKEISILQQLGIEDLDCFYWCRDKGYLSPKYISSFRDGCVLCCHAKVQERMSWYADYPSVIPKILLLQRYSKERGFYPLRGKHWFIENDEFVCGYGKQISFFEEVFY